MEFRIEKHGLFSPRRKLEMGIFVGFGASESMMTGILRGIIDGAKWASSNGYSKFAVTVADASTAEKLRELGKEADVKIMIIGVHLTGINPEDAERLLAAADIVTGCSGVALIDKHHAASSSS